MTRVLQFIAVIAILTGSVAAQTDTTFTYQGELKESGEPANGSYSVDFALWDALSNGNQVGSTIQFNNVPVAEGLFTVELDFGASVFDGSQLWLEITVDGTELAPRQPLTGTPYAIQTRGIVVDADNNVGIGTTSPECELQVANLTPGEGAETGVRAEDAAGAIAAYSSSLPPPFEHLGGRVSLFSDAATLGLDFRADAYIGDIRFYTGGLATSNERMRISSTGKVGIGVTSPSYELDVIGTISCSNPDVNGYAVHAVAYSDGGTGVYGSSGGEGGTGLFGVASGYDSRGVFGYGRDKGVVGAGAFSDSYDFYADGAGIDYGTSSSIRWKRNVELIDDPLGKISRLRGIYFDWDAEHGGRHDVGMIAEEVGAVLPEIVSYEENGIDANGMDYSKLTALLVEAVNALRAEKDAEIALRDQRIEALEKTNIDLESRLAQLETIVARPAAQQGTK